MYRFMALHETLCNLHLHPTGRNRYVAFWRSSCWGLRDACTNRQQDLMETSWPPSLTCSISLSIDTHLLMQLMLLPDYTHTHTHTAWVLTFLLGHQHWISRSHTRREEIQLPCVCVCPEPRAQDAGERMLWALLWRCECDLRADGALQGWWFDTCSDRSSALSNVPLSKAEIACWHHHTLHRPKDRKHSDPRGCWESFPSDDIKNFLYPDKYSSWSHDINKDIFSYQFSGDEALRSGAALIISFIKTWRALMMSLCMFTEGSG